nr:hypothetical protein [uncultured Allomuricauda sp.]
MCNKEIEIDGAFYPDLRFEFVVDKNGKLLSLNESKLSNQLGGSVIVFCSDGIGFATQTDKNEEHKNTISPSGSGSFNLPPYFKRNFLKDTFQELCRRETERELRQECGIRKKK